MSSARNPRLKACAACTRAKRPCSKRQPCCDRCRRRNIPCRYPPPNLTARDYAEADSGSAATEVSLTRTGAALPIHVVSFESFYPNTSEAQPGDPFHPCCTGFPENTKTLPLGHDWFYSSDSWTISRSSTIPSPTEAFDTRALKQHITTVQSWLRLWATTGRSPFIHHRLYSQKMPRCVQDAYTALAAYLARTPENSDLCFQIIRERAQELVEQAQRMVPAPTSETGSSEPTGGSMPLDPFDHLARVHALFVYQMIGLFDGDIVLRVEAESRISTLMSWVAEMWDSAELDASLYSTILALEQDVSSSEDTPAVAPADETAAWRRWILSESIRRAWLVVTITQSIYQLFKTGWSQCSGSVNWTPRAGIWDAPDQYSWCKLVTSGSGPLFVPSLRADVLYKEASPSEVDEFGHAVLIAQFGSESMTKWKAHAA
ncbi:uncharacterized protein F4817DRAFT_113804 [Daldinia loculata]|uniref:uncharacterized protein n=1 Tax=Daldinia loculata TaxID=103429 RepID=UPI0020C4C0D1|nr:uncharacterized protein F4817DRAFT_113804 [Daldinia loculata]KAI1647000.1 hypothetical protein F4817DRAFT_113804 [Daldinia loculata]